MKGQSGTEYLTVFASVLIVALIAVFLLTQYVGFGEEAVLKEAKTWWSSAYPLRIYDAHARGIYVYLYVQNVGMENIQIINASYQSIEGGWKELTFKYGSCIPAGQFSQVRQGWGDKKLRWADGCPYRDFGKQKILKNFKFTLNVSGKIVETQPHDLVIRCAGYG